ncbi:MAG: class I SAM-dependent RNA methyltransferase [Burkholderiales bacterium]|nr:class I SAM-dependent RNA methyltransferase [Burkholderiales bacterium]
MNVRTTGAERFFAPCPRGLESALAAELTALDAADVKPTDGGVAFAGPLTLAYAANLESRLASRVLWRVGGGGYRDERDLNALARSVPWGSHFHADRKIRVDVAATRSPLKSLEFATLTVKDAVCDRFRDEQGRRPSVDKRLPDVRIHAYLTDREATLYLDTSGEPLFKRGWRRDTEEAPLRENLAAGLIALAGWRPGTAFLDPMCGSGTIAIEAAMIAADRAPGLARSFGFQKLAWFDGPAWQRLKQKARDRVRPPPAEPSIHASDRHAAAVAKTRANAAAAQVEGFLRVEQADALSRPAPAASGVLIANPPYGVRLEDRERIAAMYPAWGDALKARYAGWTAWLFSGDPDLPKKFGLMAERRIPLWNGAIECRLYAYRIVSGRLPG